MRSRHALFLPCDRAHLYTLVVPGDKTGGFLGRGISGPGDFWEPWESAQPPIRWTKVWATVSEVLPWLKWVR